ncbi:MAG: hypothetical protein HY302_08280 [Opitutae bacterium]|nr:hypothetical protein [Opitutae bacterium]
MQRNGVRLGPAHRAWLFGAFAMAFVTGVAWWVLHRWFQTAGEFGPAPLPAERWLIRLHGAAAMLTLLLLGSLLTLHVKRAWLARRNRRSGTLLLALNALLAATGYALYYAGGESLRAFASRAHLALGLGLPVLLALHIAFGRRTRPGSIDDDLRATPEDESIG